LNVAGLDFGAYCVLNEKGGDFASFAAVASAVIS